MIRQISVPVSPYSVLLKDGCSKGCPGETEFQFMPMQRLQFAFCMFIKCFWSWNCSVVHLSDLITKFRAWFYNALDAKHDLVVEFSVCLKKQRQKQKTVKLQIHEACGCHTNNAEYGKKRSWMYATNFLGLWNENVLVIIIPEVWISYRLFHFCIPHNLMLTIINRTQGHILYLDIDVDVIIRLPSYLV